MKNSTKSKHYTESDTATKKSSRWFRTYNHRGDIDGIFDLYWGGKERRITGLTLRIIGVNFIALIGLILGVVYLGQYHSSLIESKLERFETEILLVTAAVTEGVLDADYIISPSRAITLSSRLGATLNKRVLIFDANDNLVADSKILIEQNKIAPIFKVFEEEGEDQLDSIKMLKSTAAWVASLFPKYNKLGLFPDITSNNANDYSDVVDAKRKKLSISAWHDEDGDIVLTAAMPILSETEVAGVVMLVGDDEGIKEDLGEAWFDILKIFMVTLLITILLSIYLSGVIARPLRKLAAAAEGVRTGKFKVSDIPDMSDRNDEIGELSIVLRDMTYALWDRMDAIESFAADVSHEIKNPLTSLKSAVETVAIVSKKKDRDKLMNVIRHDIDRLDRLITDISNASRLDAELSREVFGVINLQDVLRGILDAYRDPLDRDGLKSSNQVVVNGVDINLNLTDSGAIDIQGSESRLTQVFQNIIVNALSFAPPETEIKISVEVRSAQVIVSIEDDGAGVPEKQLSKIFERFYSERPEHEEYGRHSGLGLSICKQIITAHNGVIYAENKIDSSGSITGAKFVVILNLV